MNHKILVATCNRKPPYVHSALQSVFADKTVNQVHVVVCGASDSSFMDRWRNDKRIVIHEANDQEKKLAKKSMIERRILLTFVRALEMSELGTMTIFCEDDTVFTKNWLVKASHFVDLASASKAGHEYGGRRIIALCCPYGVKSDRAEGRHSLGPYHPSDFHCTAGFMLSGERALELAKFARRKIAKGDWLASDVMLRRYAIERPCEILASNPSLIDHIGDQSTQGFFDIRRAPSFEKE